MTRPHGTHAKYAVERCRCDPCRAAQRTYNRNRLRAIARPDVVWCPYVDAGPAREHVAWLAGCGVGLKTLARISGLSHGTLSKLVYGGPGDRPPSRRVRPTTAQKILGVMPNMATGAQKVPADPTWRLLDDLIGRGWARAELARRLGNQGPGLQINRTTVRASTARAVERLHVELASVAVVPRKTRWGVVPTPVPPRTIRRGTPKVVGVSGRRLPLAPLAEVAGMSENALCLHLGLHVARARLGIEETVADELAVRLGFHPAEVWGAWTVPA